MSEPLRRPPVAMITGITGQDGGYLAELLLRQGYVVHGLGRDPEKLRDSRLTELVGTNPNLVLHVCDMAQGGRLHELVEMIAPDEIYNLAAQSHVQKSFEEPDYTIDVNATGTVRLLKAIVKLGMERRTRFFQASSSEMFGHATGGMQNEETPFHPLNPYAVAKHAAFEATINFREAYGLHASNGILFNHESPYRGAAFVTRKISQAVAAIHLGSEECLKLGNLDTRRDWGHARDYVEGMRLMLQQPVPGDYVLATGVNRSVREFVETAFRQVGRVIEWRGSGIEEEGFDAASGRRLIAIDPMFFRPTDVNATLGDAGKARRLFGWTSGTSFEQLVREMVEADIRRLEAAPRTAALRPA
ncbi:GDP-mannose 4,6-dehydratase [Parvibaculum sp.]|uniref:GDP-mannose 4,6-dehydratase n=1 Tax=Parvibaculum sp. TaxID=2024848 RepID=UPI00321065F9